MKARFTTTILTMTATLGLSVGAARASSNYDEAIDGDLSNDRLAPTSLLFSLGTNSITATSVSGDREYVHVVIPAGTVLSSIVLASYSSLDELSFIGVQAGTILSEPPTGTNPDNLLGWTHFGDGAGNVGTDILDDLGASAPAIGFTPPLPAGDYTFWMQQTGSNAATFRFDFEVTPEPATLALLGIAAGLRRRADVRRAS